MLLFDILAIDAKEATPSTSKLHLATWNGHQDPLDVFFAGNFESWQSWQGKRNFERPLIVSLIKLPGRDRWLFAGCYRRLGRSWVEEPAPAHWSYQTAEVAATAPLSGRVVVGFERSGRAAYLDADRWASKLVVRQVLERRMAVGEFRGYHHVRLKKATLDLIVSQELQSWKGALSAVAGVYLIADTHTGRLYVGSATGEGGIWARWCQYAADGHAGNNELRKLLDGAGADYARHFQFAVLEIADTHASAEEVLRRESHWKEVLRTRDHGYNGN